MAPRPSPALEIAHAHVGWWGVFALSLVLFLPLQRADAQSLSISSTASAERVRIQIRSDDAGTRTPISYRVLPGNGVRLLTPETGSLRPRARATITVRMLVTRPRQEDDPPAQLVVRWSDDTVSTHPVRVAERVSRGRTENEPPPEGGEWTSVPVGGLSRDVELELYGSTRTAAPGGVVVLRYAVTNYEETEERVRFRLQLPLGWTLLDHAFESREWTIEPWEDVEGEVRLTVPRAAQVGERHVVGVVASVEGEPGGAAAFVRVQVVRSGGLRPGVMGLSGTTTVQATSFHLQSFEEARYGGVVDLSGSLTPRTSLGIQYRQGPRESTLSNVRITADETRFSASLRNPGWMLSVGNLVPSAGSTLTGPYVRGTGGTLRRTRGLLQGELTLLEPRSYIGDPGGHLVRGRVELTGRVGRLGVSASDFLRPAGGYSTVPPIIDPHLDPDSLEHIERERDLARHAPSNRVQGGGVEADIRNRVHRMSMRGGWLRLANAAEDSVQGYSIEAQYAFSHRLLSFGLRWREMPPSLQGVHLPGSEMAADGALKLSGDLRATGRVYRMSTETAGPVGDNAGQGAVVGLRFQKHRWRLEVRGNHREWSWDEDMTVSRTASLSLGLPVGALSLSGHAERGEQARGEARGETESYRADLRWTGNGGSFSFSTSYYTALTSDPRLRTDLLGSFTVGEFEFSGGAWATRGWSRGGEPGMWTQIGVPVMHGSLVVLGFEHAPRMWGAPPEWLGTVGFRQKLTIPLPFLPGDRALREQMRQPQD